MMSATNNDSSDAQEVDRDFFAALTVSELAGRSDYDLRRDRAFPLVELA